MKVNGNFDAARLYNAGRPGEPSATGGSNAGDIALSRVLGETARIAKEQGGKIPIIGSPEFKPIANAIVTGTITSGSIVDIKV